MKLPSLALPDDIANWPDWLDQLLLSDHLGDFVLEHEAIVGVNPSQALLAEVLEGNEQAILATGFRAASESQMRSLISHPRLLFELQERVLTEGGSHWHRAAPAIPENAWTQIDAAMTAADSKTAGSADTEITPSSKQAAETRSRRGFGVLALTALCCTVGVGFWFQFGQSTKPKGWGFNQSDLLTADLPAKEYLRSLADAGQAWFNKRPENRDALELRLKQFSKGCQQLIDAEHSQLVAADREWLRERCQAWKDKVDLLIVGVNSGETSIGEARDAADEIVTKLVEALRTRSDTVG